MFRFFRKVRPKINQDVSQAGQGVFNIFKYPPPVILGRQDEANEMP